MSDHFTEFEQALAREGKSPLTVKNYRNDLQHFAAWFAQSNGEEFAPAGITLLDVRAYKSHLVTLAQFKPATVNRRLAALAKYCRWAKAAGLIGDDPTAEVKGASQVKAAPKGFCRFSCTLTIR